MLQGMQKNPPPEPMHNGVLTLMNMQAQALDNQDEKTHNAFVEMIGTLRKNYEELVKNQSLLQARITALETQLETSDKLRQEEKNARDAVIMQIKKENNLFNDLLKKRIFEENEDTDIMQNFLSLFPEKMRESQTRTRMVNRYIDDRREYVWKFPMLSWVFPNTRLLYPKFAEMVAERKKRPLESVLDNTLQKKDTEMVVAFYQTLKKDLAAISGTCNYPSIPTNFLEKEMVPFIKKRQARENA